jgi:hypothetical protein
VQDTFRIAECEYLACISTGHFILKFNHILRFAAKRINKISTSEDMRNNGAFQCMFLGKTGLYSLVALYVVDVSYGINSFRPEFFLNNELREDFMYILLMQKFLVLHIELLLLFMFYFILLKNFTYHRSTDCYS